MVIGFLIASVAASVHSIIETRKARKEAAKAANVAKRRRAVESRRATVAGVEDARQAIGQVQNIAAQTGGAGGSGAQGAAGSLASQFGSNATFNQQLLRFAERQGTFLDRVATAQNRASRASSFAAIFKSAAGGSAN